MKGSDLVRIIDEMQHQKNIDREIIFAGIESALQLAAEKKYGEEPKVTVVIDRDTGDIIAKRGEEIVVVAGVPFGTPGATNILRIAYV